MKTVWTDAHTRKLTLLAANGRTLGIEFSVEGSQSSAREVKKVLAQHAFPAEKEEAFIAQLTSQH